MVGARFSVLLSCWPSLRLETVDVSVLLVFLLLPVDIPWSGIPFDTMQRLNTLDNAIKSAAEEAEDLCGDVVVPRAMPKCHWWWFVSSIAPNAC